VSNQTQLLKSQEKSALTNKQPIHDLFIRELTVEETDGLTKFHVLCDEDHLLRRFGEVLVIRKSPGRSETLCLREVADEVWTLIEGQVEFAWHDLRQDSPSQGHWHHLHAETPTLVLAPFGVAFGCRALEEPALLIRLSTHAEGEHSGDREMPWEF
jgi:dTDP-4-dehydrorhamnose 3,5-epimerase-like enzyme